ncbi:MAG: type III-A CRISPR-associated RAMP protein Csm3 [Bacteroidota bacterium]
MNFKANILIKGKIDCITGLHIGGSQDKMEIGGVDSPVVRDPITNYPYIPGSSLKGRMRALLEYCLDAVEDNGKPSEDKRILSLFGTSADYETKQASENKNKLPKDFEHPGPTPLIVRDSKPDEQTIEEWKNLDSDLLYTEFKAENTIDRISSEATPRFIERIAAGSSFHFEMVYTVYDQKKEKSYFDIVNEDLENLLTGLRLLEDNSLGKSGSRGYGKIRFQLADPIIVKNTDYIKCTEQYKKSKKYPAIGELKSLSEFTAFTYTK